MVGSLARIKPEAWSRYLSEQSLQGRPVPPPQIVVAMPVHTPFHDRVLLSFPHYWWHEDDVTIVPD